MVELLDLRNSLHLDSSHSHHIMYNDVKVWLNGGAIRTEEFTPLRQ